VLGKLARSFVLAALVLVIPLGCGKDETKDEPGGVEVLPAASNGSPVSVKFLEFTGNARDGERGLKVLVYNGGDKTAAAYNFLFRFYDDKGRLLKIRPDTPLAADHGFATMSGKKFVCEPKQNATVAIDPMLADVPFEAVRAEILVSQVRALAGDGKTIEDWWSQENWDEWPTGS
jgi:hypothetical protein